MKHDFSQLFFVNLKKLFSWDFSSLLFSFFQPSRHDSPPSSSLNYVHKIHAATTSKSTPSTTDGSLTTPTPTKLWSVARLSLECNNNNNNNNINTTNNSFDERNSFYQHLSQIQHKNFHHIDTSASNASSI